MLKLVISGNGGGQTLIDTAERIIINDTFTITSDERDKVYLTIANKTFEIVDLCKLVVK